MHIVEEPLFLEYDTLVQQVGDQFGCSEAFASWCRPEDIPWKEWGGNPCRKPEKVGCIHNTFIQ
jgi:hypothetical protein